MLFTEQLHAFGILVCTCGHGTGIMVNFAAVRYFTTQTGPITATVAAFLEKKEKRPCHNFQICSVTAAMSCGSILSSGGQSVLLSSKCCCSPVSSEEHQSHHPPLPLIFYSQCFPLLCELLRILFSSYPLNSETLIPSTIYNIVYMSWGLDEG